MDDAIDGATCPHVDRDDRRCNQRFGIQRIDQALRVCFGAYHACPLYHRINREMLLPVTVTAHGLPLRATGS